jgi:hypothetical protein
MSKNSKIIVLSWIWNPEECNIKKMIRKKIFSEQRTSFFLFLSWERGLFVE